MQTDLVMSMANFGDVINLGGDRIQLQLRKKQVHLVSSPIILGAYKGQWALEQCSNENVFAMRLT